MSQKFKIKNNVENVGEVAKDELIAPIFVIVNWAEQNMQHVLRISLKRTTHIPTQKCTQFATNSNTQLDDKIKWKIITALNSFLKPIYRKRKFIKKINLIKSRISPSSFSNEGLGSVHKHRYTHKINCIVCIRGLN